MTPRSTVTPEEWTRTPFAAKCERGPVTVDAWTSAAAPGIAIHPTLSPYLGWTVSHVATGRSMIRGIGDESKARSAALELAGKADWTKSIDELKADGLNLIDTMEDVRGKFGGLR